MCYYVALVLLFMGIITSGWVNWHNHLPPWEKGYTEQEIRPNTDQWLTPILLSQEVKVLRLLFLGEAIQPVIVHEK